MKKNPLKRFTGHAEAASPSPRLQDIAWPFLHQAARVTELRNEKQVRRYRLGSNTEQELVTTILYVFCSVLDVHTLLGESDHTLQAFRSPFLAPPLKKDTGMGPPAISLPS